jgi:hypothetical protein
MEKDLLQALLSGKRIKPKLVEATKEYALIREADGKVKRVLLADVKGGVGEFDSKLGSTKRSRKGRTYRAANGYARYAANHETEVIAYLP